MRSAALPPMGACGAMQLRRDGAKRSLRTGAAELSEARAILLGSLPDAPPKGLQIIGIGLDSLPLIHGCTAKCVASELIAGQSYAGSLSLGSLSPLCSCRSVISTAISLVCWPGLPG